MNNISFNDIFKSNFLEKTSSFSLIDSLVGLLVAFAVGFFIYLVYKKTFSGVVYSHTFNISLIAMSMITALIIMGISSNVLLSLGMVGALSIVRFRTPIKDPIDIVFLFWAIASGILCGAGFIPLVIIGSVLIGIVLVLFVNKVTVENPYLLIVKYENESIENLLEGLVARNSKKHMIKSKSFMSDNAKEIIYELRVKSKGTGFMEEVSRLEGVKSAVMLSYDGNFTA